MVKQSTSTQPFIPWLNPLVALSLRRGRERCRLDFSEKSLWLLNRRANSHQFFINISCCCFYVQLCYMSLQDLQTSIPVAEVERLERCYIYCSGLLKCLPWFPVAEEATESDTGVTFGSFQLRFFWFSASCRNLRGQLCAPARVWRWGWWRCVEKMCWEKTQRGNEKMRTSVAGSWGCFRQSPSSGALTLVPSLEILTTVIQGTPSSPN